MRAFLTVCTLCSNLLSLKMKLSQICLLLHLLRHDIHCHFLVPRLRLINQRLQHFYDRFQFLTRTQFSLGAHAFFTEGTLSLTIQCKCKLDILIKFQKVEFVGHYLLKSDLLLYAVFAKEVQAMLYIDWCRSHT